MLSIQMEIKDLKMEVEKGEAALKSDGTVAKLETEVKWFIGKLENYHFISVSNDLKNMYSKMNAID